MQTFSINSMCLFSYVRFTDKWPPNVVVWQHWKMLSRFQRNLITMVFVAVVVTVVYYWGLKEQVKLEEQKADLMNPQMHQPQPQRADLEVSRGRVYTLGFWNMSTTKYTPSSYQRALCAYLITFPPCVSWLNTKVIMEVIKPYKALKLLMIC